MLGRLSRVTLLLGAAGLLQGGQSALRAQAPILKTHCDAYPRRNAPIFRVAGRSGTTPTPGLTLYVSVASLDFNREKLIALGCKMGRNHRRDNQLWVWIFDSYTAAKWQSAPRKGSDPEADRARIAVYSFGRAAGDYGQYLRLPDPDRPNEYIRIDLGEPPTK